MDSATEPRTNWKERFIALGIGIVVGFAVFGIAVFISDDLRLLYVAGIVLLGAAAFFPGAKLRSDWIATVLLFLPPIALFAFFVLPQTGFLWPTPVVWAATAVFVLFRDKWNRAMAIGGAFLLVAFSAWFCLAYIPPQVQRVMTRVDDRAAPQFLLQPISEGRVPIQPTPGKILVIDFFATWCSPCIAELPELEHLRADLQSNRDVEFVLAGTSSGGDSPARLRAFAQRRHLAMPLAFDPDHKTMRALGLTGFPSLLVIDRAGHVRLTHQGYNTSEANFRHDLTQLLQSL